ncbi:helix-turn-helix domain-containing protein [Pseudomonas sp. Pseu.R1]|uniref:helix-turn-helix domain-containing protein n=1 Tax=Pseudomonas sp. Pseu.R1 TaxID=3379818 RepID=UPI003B94DB92
MLTKEVAANVRAVRAKRGVTQEGLAEVSVQKAVSQLEQAKVKVSLEKLQLLATALDFDLVALVALCVSLERGENPEDSLKQAAQVLESFRAEGGMDILALHYQTGNLTKRSRGKPANLANLKKVLDLKAEGLSQAETARRLGLTSAAVSRYWRKG